MHKCLIFLTSIVGLTLAINTSVAQTSANIWACDFNDGNITFICDDSEGYANHLFTHDGQSQCRNQWTTVHHGSIGRINFGNCDQPQIPENILEVCHNAYSLNMADTGSTLY